MGQVFYYIDETGTLDAVTGDERFFILSCCITDTPESVREQLITLRTKIENSPYFEPYLAKFMETGFHASKNHLNIISRYYELLPNLNIRIYSIILDKTSQVYTDLLKRHIGDTKEIYIELLHVLLNKRIESNRSSDNKLIFEECGDSKVKYRGRIEVMLQNIVRKIIRDFDNETVTIAAEVHGKEDIVLSVVDYANYLFFQMLNKSKTEPTMKGTFELILPKIGLVHCIHNKKFYSEKNRINFAEIKGQGNM